jgi:hypothetical protein
VLTVTIANDYHYLTYADDYDQFGVGYSNLDAGYDADPRTWEMPLLELRDGVPADYQANDMGWRLCSIKLRQVLDEYLSPHDAFWLPVIVAWEGAEFDYSVLVPPDRSDLLDQNRSIFADEGRFLVKPVLDSRRVGSDAVFTIGGRTQTLVVRRDLKDAVEHAECTGISFEKVAAS